MISACDRLVATGVRQISLADTVGLATPARIAETAGAVREAHGEIEFGVHLHARREERQPGFARHLMLAAGVLMRQSAALGGCPFAQDSLVGNIPTEILITTLTECRAELPKLEPLDGLTRASAGNCRKLWNPGTLAAGFAFGVSGPTAKARYDELQDNSGCG